MKYIWAPMEGTKELYNLDEDPEELDDMIENLRDKIELWWNERPEQSIDQQSLEKLKSFLYNLDEDPEELLDIIEELEEMIRLWWEREHETRHKGPEQSIDQQSLEKLKSLGYVE